jgi:hypothetical protein
MSVNLELRPNFRSFTCWQPCLPRPAKTPPGEGLDLLGIWRGASFALIHQTGFGEPSKGAPHGSEITCFAADA